MKRFVCLLTLSLLITCTLHAQTETPKFIAEIHIGASIPIGKFADKNYESIDNDNPSGLANVGQAGNITLRYYINESVGALLTAGYSTNRQDEKSVREMAEKMWMPNASRIDVETNSWNVIHAMVGGFLVTSLSTNDKLNLVTKLSAGICKATIPAWSYTATGSGGMQESWGKQDKTSLPAAFCYQISMGLQYQLNDRLHLLFDVNSFNATPKKTMTYSLSASPMAGGPYITQENKYKIGMVNVLAGVGFSF